MSTQHQPTTAQDIFDTVALHLIVQGRRAILGTHCRYRTPSGDRCAIGVLLPDGVYNRQMEGASVRGNCKYLPVSLQAHMALLVNLQELHDDIYLCEPGSETVFDQKRLKAALATVADVHGLSARVLAFV
jgi:hypothetical protein